MAELDHEKIRIIAYQLWERDGCPAGKDDEYWHAAVKLLSDEVHAGLDDVPLAIEPTPTTRKTTAAKPVKQATVRPARKKS